MLNCWRRSTGGSSRSMAFVIEMCGLNFTQPPMTPKSFVARRQRRGDVCACSEHMAWSAKFPRPIVMWSPKKVDASSLRCSQLDRPVPKNSLPLQLRNLRGLNKLLWIVVRINTNQEGQFDRELMVLRIIDLSINAT